jgi:hypothetical protein
MKTTATKPAQAKATPIKLATKVASKVIETEKKRVVILVEGVTGKSLMQAKLNANNASKTEVKSISFCINQVNKHGQDFLTSFAKYNKKDITPANLLPLRTEKQVERGTFSVWLIMQLITKFYKG